MPKLELTWTNKGDNLALDTHTNAINGEVRGQRIFVGAKTPTETNPRNTVLLHIKTIPPLIGSNVWLRSFDVDDTTDDRRFDQENLVDANGRLGEDNLPDYLSTPKAGLFVGSGSSMFGTNLNSSGEAWVEFRVGMQPGNNYRVAATVFPTSQLNSLQSGTAGEGYVSAYTDQIRGGFNGVLSPLLTVWRKLHLEIDSMTAPPTNGPQANFVSLKILNVRTNFPNIGQTAVYFRPTAQPWQANRYENGTLTIPSIATKQVIVGQAAEYVWQANNYLNYLVVPGNIPAHTVGMEAQLRDDDDRFLAELSLFPPGQSSPLPRDQLSGETVNGVRAAFFPAYVEFVDANAIAGLNPRRTIPFQLHANMSVLDGNGGIFNNAKDLYDSKLFWAHTAVFGYEPRMSEDGDPDRVEGLKKGVTAKKTTLYHGGVSAIFCETVREEAANLGLYLNQGDTLKARNEYNGWLWGTVAHECAHAPGNQSEGQDHAEDNIMIEGGSIMDVNRPQDSFSTETIKRIRVTKQWAE